MKYVALSIGCLECSVETHVIGVFDSKDAAIEGLHAYEELHPWRGKRSGSDICNVIKACEDTNEAQLQRLLKETEDDSN